jgi:hypothetical protein
LFSILNWIAVLSETIPEYPSASISNDLSLAIPPIAGLQDICNVLQTHGNQSVLNPGLQQQQQPQNQHVRLPQQLHHILS